MWKWHIKSVVDVLGELQSAESGLTDEEAKKRLQEYGYNKLPETKVDSLAVIFLRQFQSSLIYILFAASLVMFAIKETIDGIIVFFVLFF